ncbi:tRNA lysidine(34) synthetase TilS [Marinibaculum pumilum]|uniref:tRNA(Ile)-lysidine synthase n=1 Tax=Marinibaculum pumilum TaxID=1766165 RepID=A0ABV7L7B9_9PROT
MPSAFSTTPPPAAMRAQPEAGLAARFAAALRRIGLPDGPLPDGLLLLAVSGGGDSIALLHLMHGRPELRHRLAVATVDHGLRPEAAAEAAQVGRWAAALGLSHQVLKGRPGDLPAGGLQAAARALRYRLLDEAASSAGAAAILLAHNADDQAETVEMRLQRGTGHDGLGGMAPVVRRHDLPGRPLLLRPLLGFGRAELRHWLRRQALPWLEDPSNGDPRFERIRVRRTLDGDGRRERLVAAAEAARRRARERGQAADALLRRALVLSPHGDDRLSLAPLAAAGDDMACHLLRGLLSSGGTAPAHDAVARLWRGLSGGTPAVTLAGCLFHRLAGGRYLLLRERRQPLPELPITPGLATGWGDRFRLHVPDRWLPPPAADGAVPVLREFGAMSPARAARLLCGAGPAAAALRDLLQALPAPARPGLPAIYRGSRLAGLPTLPHAAGSVAGLSAADIGLSRAAVNPFRPWHWETLAAALTPDQGVACPAVRETVHPP